MRDVISKKGALEFEGWPSSQNIVLKKCRLLYGHHDKNPDRCIFKIPVIFQCTV